MCLAVCSGSCSDSGRFGIGSRLVAQAATSCDVQTDQMMCMSTGLAVACTMSHSLKKRICVAHVLVLIIGCNFTSLSGCE